MLSNFPPSKFRCKTYFNGIATGIGPEGWLFLSMKKFTFLLLPLFFLFVAGGCSDGRKPTYPVKGKILVDGQPAFEAFIWFHPVDKNDPMRVVPFAQADEQGNFNLNSYITGDGSPTGDFIITFEWPRRSGTFKTQFEGPDRLKDKYKNIEGSKFKVSIDKQGKDLGTFELTAN